MHLLSKPGSLLGQIKTSSFLICVFSFTQLILLSLCKSKLNIDFISSQLAWPCSRVITTTNAGEDVMKQEPLYAAGGNAN
jgi:hypothetical protein